MPDDIKPTGPDLPASASETAPANIDMSLPPQPQLEQPTSRWQRVKNWCLSHKKIMIPILIVVFILILCAVPWSRYKMFALVIKQNFSVRVVDATTKSPVSGVLVTVGQKSVETDASGTAHLRLAVGTKQIHISKKYYLSSDATSLVPILKQKTIPTFALKATGRQVNVSLTDLISGKALANVDIEVAGISAQTDSRGKAQLVLPAGISKQQATLSLDGYNDAKVNINVSDQQVAQNNLTMTPVGKVYFLSNRSGSLDVMKVNLDGTDPQVVIKGATSEGVDSTALTQSPDGKYVVLEAKRQSSDKTPQLYVMATADDQLYSFDSGDVNFSIIGWAGDSLVYTASSNTMADWQAGKQKIKSYDASNGKTSVIDSSGGTDPDRGAYETYGKVYLATNKVVFDTIWYTVGSDDLSDQKDTLISASITGQGKQTAASYTASTNVINAYQYAPNSFYVEVADSATTTYYDYSPGGNFKKITQPSDSQLYSNVQYYSSPDNSQSAWSEQRDGKQTVITADAYGGSAKTQIAGYDVVGWYTDKYIIATNLDQSEIYIMTPGGAPIKLTGYQPTYIY